MVKSLRQLPLSFVVILSPHVLAMPVVYLNPQDVDNFNETREDFQSLLAELAQSAASSDSAPDATGSRATVSDIQPRLSELFQRLDLLGQAHYTARSPLSRNYTGAHEPKSRAECVWRYVAPEYPNGLTSLSASGPLGTSTTDLANAFSSEPRLTKETGGVVVTHDIFVDVFLHRALARNITMPPISSPDAPRPSELDSQSRAFVGEWIVMLDGLERVCRDADLHYESDQMGAARLFLAQLANIFCLDPDNFTDVPGIGRRNASAVPAWTTAQQEKFKGLTDWCLRLLHDKLAFMEIKRKKALKDEHFTKLYDQSQPMLQRLGVGDELRFWIEKKGSRFEVVTNSPELNQSSNRPVRNALLQVRVSTCRMLTHTALCPASQIRSPPRCPLQWFIGFELVHEGRAAHVRG